MEAESTGTRLDLEATRQELEDIRERMEVLKKETTVEVEANWASQWRNPELVALKVETRLTGNQEYRALITRARDAEALLSAAEAGTS